MIAAGRKQLQTENVDNLSICKCAKYPRAGCHRHCIVHKGNIFLSRNLSQGPWMLKSEHESLSVILIPVGQDSPADKGTGVDCDGGDACPSNVVCARTAPPCDDGPACDDPPASARAAPATNFVL